MDELGEDARGLLEAFRAEERPSAPRRDAILKELEAAGSSERPRRKIRSTSRGRVTAPSSGASRVSTRRWIPIGALAVAAALVLVASRWALLDGSAVEGAALERPSEAAHQLESQTIEGVAAPLERDRSTSLQHVTPRETPADTAETVDVATPMARPKPSSGSRAHDGEGGGELELIEHAQRALRDGRPARALELLERHSGSYPRGALSEESTFLRAQALCATGRLAEARTLATDFVATRPESAYAGKMRRVCVQRPSGR